MTTARLPPMVPVTEPKLAPLLGQVLELIMELDPALQDPWPSASVVGIVMDLPVPLKKGF